MGKRQKRLFPGPLLLQEDEEALTDDAPGKGIYPAVVSAFTKRVDDNDRRQRGKNLLCNRARMGKRALRYIRGSQIAWACQHSLYDA